MVDYIFREQYKEKEVSESRDQKLEVCIEYDKDARIRGYYLVLREVVIEDRGDYAIEIVNIHEDFYKRFLLTEVIRKSKKAEKESINKAIDFLSTENVLRINNIYPILDYNLSDEIVEDIRNRVM